MPIANGFGNMFFPPNNDLSVKTTMIDTHVLNQGGLRVRSPLD